jgi:opacity protein-like surface antigen
MKFVCQSLFCLLLYASRAMAQEPLPAAIAPVSSASFGYSNMSRDSSAFGRVGLNGANLGITEDFSSRRGVLLDFGYLRASNAFGTGHHSDILSYMAGPVVYLARRPEFVINVHGLVGGARVRGVVPLSHGGFAIGHVHDIAWAFGAGIEHWFSDSMALRISCDGMRTSFYNSSQVVHGQFDLRTTASVVYYFEKRRSRRH